MDYAGYAMSNKTEYYKKPEDTGRKAARADRLRREKEKLNELKTWRKSLTIDEDLARELRGKKSNWRGSSGF